MAEVFIFLGSGDRREVGGRSQPTCWASEDPFARRATSGWRAIRGPTEEGENDSCSGVVFEAAGFASRGVNHRQTARRLDCRTSRLNCALWRMQRTSAQRVSSRILGTRAAPSSDLARASQRRVRILGRQTQRWAWVTGLLLRFNSATACFLIPRRGIGFHTSTVARKSRNPRKDEEPDNEKQDENNQTVHQCELYMGGRGSGRDRMSAASTVPARGIPRF